MEIIKKIVQKNDDIYNAKPVTIAFLGDSVTQGCFEVYYKLDGRIETIFDSENTYSSKLKKLINYICPSAQINIINSGISGDNAPNGLKRFDRDIAPFNPDLVVVGFALNDSTRGKDGLNDYLCAVKGIFDKVKGIGAECILLTPNLMNDRVSPHLSEKLQKLAADFLNFTSLDDYVNAVKELAERENVPVCDVYSKWKKMQTCGIDTTELLANKLNHPKRELHWMTAYSLLETMFND